MIAAGISLWSRAVPGIGSLNPYTVFLLAFDPDHSKYYQKDDNT